MGILFGIALGLTLTIVLMLLILASIFPDRFEAMGITMFHNRESGVFTECFSENGNYVAACETKVRREIKEGAIEPKPDPRGLKKPRIVPFTFD